MDESSIIKKLSSFELTLVEAKIYLYLVGKTGLSVLDISRALTLPRTTIYDAILHLIEVGLVERIIEYKTQLFRAHNISILQSIIDKKKNMVDTLSQNLIYLSSHIHTVATEVANTEVRYYHGAEGFRQMMWHALNAKNGHIGYSELGRVEVVGKKFLTTWMEEMISRKINDRVIINPKKETLAHLSGLGEHEFRRFYQTSRMIPQKTLYISGDTTIYNNIFAVAWWKKNEVVGVEIENPEMVKAQRSIFNILWQLAKPIQKK